MLGFGALGEYPLGDFGWVGPGVSISLPPVLLTLSRADLMARAGKNIDLPAVTINLVAPSATITAGKNIDLPIVTLKLTAPQINAAAGKSFNLPAVNLTMRYSSVRIQTGRIVNLVNTLTRTNDVGALGEGALGEFGLGEGEPLAQQVERPVTLRVSTRQLAVLAGRNLDLPAINLALRAPVPEVAARRRPLRVLAITS